MIPSEHQEQVAVVNWLDFIALPSADTDTDEANTDEDKKLIGHYQKQIRNKLGMNPFEGGE